MSRARVETYKRDGGQFLTLRIGTGAMEESLLDEVDAAIGQADLDSTVTCVVLRIVQSAGVPETAAVPILPGDVIARRLRLDASILAARRIPKPVILLQDATLAGECIGLFAAADIVLATHESVLRPGGVPAALLGMVPALQQRGHGVRQALLCLLEGRDLDAHAARHLGLVTDVLPSERLEPVLDALLRGITTAGPTGVALLKAASH